MSQPSGPRPPLNVHGAVDLSSLARPAAGEPGGLALPGPYVIDATTESFGEVVQASTQYPVVIALWASWSENSQNLLDTLAALAEQLAGAFQLARVDFDAHPQIAQALRAQSVPTTVALLAGQPLPLFEGVPDAAQLRGVIDQVVAAAQANGITGRAPRGAEDVPAEPEEPPLPPLHQEAYDAIERDDLDAAVAAYERALADNPRDDLARAGLAQVQLLARTRGVDAMQVRATAAVNPKDVDAQLAVADLDVATGAVEDGFARLIDLIRVVAGDERDRIRERLVELFEVVGGADPRVVAARRDLASALY